MVGSVLNEGLRGIQGAQRELQRSATEIARANVRDIPQTPLVDPTIPSVLPPVEETGQARQRGIEEPLIELRRQEQLFTASAKVVSVANNTLGSLIDVTS